MRRILCLIGLHRWAKVTAQYRKGGVVARPAKNEDWSMCAVCGKEKRIWRAPEGDLSVPNLEEMVQKVMR